MNNSSAAFPRPTKETVEQFCMDAWNGNLEAVRTFLDTYSNQGIDEKDKDTGSALMYAARTKQKDVVRLLLERGASPHEKNITGTTVLMFAVSGGDKEIVTWIINRGVALDAQTDSDGHTALMQATLGYLPDIARLLLDHGASLSIADKGLDRADKQPQTVLMMAKRYGNREKFVEMFEREQKKRRREAFSVFTTGLKKNLRTRKLQLKLPRR